MPMEYMNEEARRRAAGDSSAPRSSHCSTLCGEHDGDDYELVDSAWLKGIQGVEESPLKIRFGRVLVFSCDQGQWVAYSNGSSHWHKLVNVECRRDVRLLLRAMKLDA